jgi:release factor glutamine methyltransferase
VIAVEKSWGQALADLTDRLRAVGIASARLDARLLFAHALGVDKTAVFSHPERLLSAEARARLEGLAGRRLCREPMSHILGVREFWSLSFVVTADTLDPRPDTETVVEAVLAEVRDLTRPLRLIDFGSGTGCILLALLSELPNACGLAVDANANALAVAKRNAQSLGLEGRVDFVLSDWGNDVDGTFDIIVSNPPYIPDGDIPGLEPEVAAFEPRMALAGGTDGLDCYRSLAPDVARLLARNGIAAFEIGLGQAADVTGIFAEHGLRLVAARRDLAGVERCLVMGFPAQSQ